VQGLRFDLGLAVCREPVAMATPSRSSHVPGNPGPALCWHRQCADTVR